MEHDAWDGVLFCLHRHHEFSTTIVVCSKNVEEAAEALRLFIGFSIDDPVVRVEGQIVPA